MRNPAQQDFFETDPPPAEASPRTKRAPLAVPTTAPKGRSGQPVKPFESKDAFAAPNSESLEALLARIDLSKCRVQRVLSGYSLQEQLDYLLGVKPRPRELEDAIEADWADPTVDRGFLHPRVLPVLKELSVEPPLPDPLP